MEQWTISRTSFDQFLGLLHPDREQAGYEYQALRERIVRFFEWRACPDAESLADEAFDRVTRKISQGEDIVDAARYAFGVAKLLLLESNKKQKREEPILIDFPVAKTDETDDQDEALSCLERCLSRVTDGNRALILRYYSFEKKAKIDDRRKLADELGLTINALRIKALRVRAKVEECVMSCLSGRK